MTEEPKKKRILDKILMGAVIGGAIGSVIGASIAPKKGEETRKDIVEKSVPVFKKIGVFIKRLFKKGQSDEVKKIPHEMNK